MWMRFALFAFVTLAIAPSIAQQAPSAGELGQHTIRQPYDLEAFGAFRSLVLNGDFTPKVVLQAAMAKQPTTGVGAVAQARGEVTIYDGKLIVSYGREASRARAETESAALLAIATVPGWQTIAVEHDIAPTDIEGFLARMAAARGLKPDSSFSIPNPWHAGILRDAR